MFRRSLLTCLALTLACAGEKSSGDDTNAAVEAIDADNDGYTADADCDDANADVHPDAQELCGGLDEDCDGLVDEADDSLDASTLVTVYTDADGDTFGDPSTGASACAPPAGTVTNNEDCDDTNPSANPSGVEVCDAGAVDEDCDGLINEADDSLTDGQTLYLDSDGDGYGDAAVVTCFGGEGLVEVGGDCDDANTAANPGAVEICDEANVDEDCDGAADDLDADATGRTTFYTDGDGDGWGGAVAGDRCEALAGEAAVGGDCDDTDPALNGDDVDADTFSTCDGDCDDANPSLTPATCAYTYATGIFDVATYCDYAVEGPATSSFPACPDCDYGFDTAATLTAGTCIGAFTAILANDIDTNTLSFDLSFYGTPVGELGPFSSTVTAGVGYDILDWYGTTGYGGYYAGTLFLYR